MLHTHRIVPGHIGGTYEPDNTIQLTVEQHAEAHRVLWEQFGRKEDFVAWKSLSGQISNQERQAELCHMGGKWHLGKIRSDKTRQNISKSLKGKTKSIETRKKMSEAAKLHIGEKNNFYGKTHSPESGLKMSRSRLGNTNCVGRIYSPETLHKMSLAAKARWARKRGV
jgi:hypothetical protein